MADFSTKLQEIFDLVAQDDVEEVIAKLDEQPEFINSVNGVGSQTLLITASLHGSLLTLQELLKRNVFAINDVDQDGTTPLIAAAKGGFEECTSELLRSGADAELKDKDGWGAVTWAAYRGYSNIVKLLLEWKANPNEVANHGMNPLIWASGRGHIDVVEELLKAGANPDSCDKYGTSAMVWAARKGHTNVVKLLLKWNASIDQSGNNGWTPLIMSSKEGFDNTVTLLIENGANVNALDQDHNSALVWAVKQGHAGIVRKLANYGAYINVNTKEGDPLLTLASKHGKLAIVRILLDNYADVDALDQAGNSALWYAVEGGYVEVVKELLEFGALTESTKKDGESPLLWAVKKKLSDITLLLVERNADLSVCDKKGDTVLHIAVRCRFRRILEIILKDARSARLLYQTNRAGETPYRIDQRLKKSVLKPLIGMTECDRKHTEELLGHDIYTTSLAELLCEPSLEPPLTVGLYSRWGNSKTHFFKRLQQEIEEITQHILQERTPLNCFAVLVCLFICLVLGICFTAAFNWVIGVIVFGAVFILSCLLHCIIIIAESKTDGNGEPSCIGHHLCQFFNSLHLSYLVAFCLPPTLMSLRSSLPVQFVFADFTRLTRSSCETTALVSMIETLNDIIEAKYGCIASRLYRVLRPPVTDYMGTRHAHWQYKKCCCCLPKLLIFIFVFVYGAMSLVLYTIVGSSENSLVTGLQISGACVVGISLVVQSTTVCSIIYTLLFSPKKRVSIMATQLGLKEEGFIHALKQEVELLTDLIISLDGFMKIQTRVVLFIDGLENSEQQKMLHLIDSINLLFTDPDSPFISVVAMDPRVTMRAIEQNFSNVLQDSHITALDYLKSIIHLPIFFPEPKLNVVGNVPGALALSIEQLLRQRKTSGFELEWEGESFELMPGSKEKAKWKSNGAVSVAQRQSSGDQCHHEEKMTARLTSSEVAINVDKTDESPDLTHILANNETLTPLGIQRLLHTTSLSGRLLRAKGFSFQWDSLAAWVSLVDSWPYRMSWLVLIMEEFTDILPDNLPLKSLYAATNPWLPSLNGFDYAIDNDPMYFESFLGSHFPIMKVDDLRRFLVGTISLDPIIRNQISQALQASSNKTLNKAEGTSVGGFGLEQPESTEMAQMSEEDVCTKLSQIDGIQLVSLPSYQNSIRENHINGPVLLQCDMSELRGVMGMSFGDWQLFKAWISKSRPQPISNESGSLTWVGLQDRQKTTSQERSLDMGNIPCTKSSSAKSRDNNKGTCKIGHDPKTTSIPRIVLDPGSTLSEPSHPGDDDEPRCNVDAAKGVADECDMTVVDGTTKKETPDLYTITSCTSVSSQSSDGEAENDNENTPLMISENKSIPCEAPYREQRASSDTSSEDCRPLLVKQIKLSEEDDQTREPVCGTVDCGSEADPSSSNGIYDDHESQLPIPILFKVSPTKEGYSQVVSSVIATRDLTSALSRPLSAPPSPKSKSQVKTPRSPKSPRSARALRDFFNCRGSNQSAENDVNVDIDTPLANDNKKDINEPNAELAIHNESDATEACASQLNENMEPCRTIMTPDNTCMDGGSCSGLPLATLSYSMDSTHRVQENTSTDNNNISTADCQLEETANNSDKGYESVDNSPSIDHEDEQSTDSVRTNGAVTNRINYTSNPMWTHAEESKSLSNAQSTKTFYSQTMV